MPVTGTNSPARWARSVVVVVGVLLLLDSASQLLIATMPWNPGNASWRAVTGRLLLTQVTPLCLAGCLIAGGLVRRPSGWRSTGIIALAAALAAVLVTLGWWGAARDYAGRVPDLALPSYNRGLVQGLTSGIVMSLGLAAAGIIALREARGRTASSGL